MRGSDLGPKPRAGVIGVASTRCPLLAQGFRARMVQITDGIDPSCGQSKASLDVIDLEVGKVCQYLCLGHAVGQHLQDIAGTNAHAPNARAAAALVGIIGDAGIFGVGRHLARRGEQKIPYHGSGRAAPRLAMAVGGWKRLFRQADGFAELRSCPCGGGDRRDSDALDPWGVAR